MSEYTQCPNGLLISDILDIDYDIDRLKELVQADLHGRCKILPCKMFDTVYFISDDSHILSGTVIEISFGDNDLCMLSVAYETPPDYYVEYVDLIEGEWYPSKEAAEIALQDRCIVMNKEAL